MPSLSYNQYKSAFINGIDAAQRREYNRQEIHAIVEEFKQAIVGITEGKINIVIETRYQEELPYQPPEEYQAFVAKLAGMHHHYSPILAIWEMSAEGYPCMLSFGTDEYTSRDAETLRHNLALMLEHPSVGKKLYELMQYSANEEAVTHQEKA